MLGEICYHQKCISCGKSCSRIHGVECSKVDAEIKQRYPDLVKYIHPERNILDLAFNRFRLVKPTSADANFLALMIKKIIKKCCNPLFQIDDHG